jgi:hypothetical protein
MSKLAIPFLVLLGFLYPVLFLIGCSEQREVYETPLQTVCANGERVYVGNRDHENTYVDHPHKTCKDGLRDRISWEEVG